METYLKNGTIIDKQYILEDDDNFCIQKLNDRYMYPGDSINYDLDNELVALYDTFRDLFFSNIDAYYEELGTMPIFVQEAGLSSDCAFKKDFFMKLLNEYAEKYPIGFDMKFTQKLYEYARRQRENRIPNYDERLKDVYSRYSSEDLIKFAIHKNVMKEVKI